METHPIITALERAESIYENSYFQSYDPERDNVVSGHSLTFQQASENACREAGIETLKDVLENYLVLQNKKINLSSEFYLGEDEFDTIDY